MTQHSMIFDDFFQDPKRTKALINRQPMEDIEYEADGVVYPNIARLPESVAYEMRENMKTVYGPAFKEVLSFARYSFADTKPPHWAHSDYNIAQFLGLVYLNEDQESFGTAVLRHKEMGFETHPTTEFQKKILLEHANKKDKWDITYQCPARFNRMFVLNAGLVHAAMGEYGSSRDDGRLVVSIFFNMVPW